MTKQLIYVGDPMCSWCWGFAPVKRRIEELCHGRAEVSLVVGGLEPTGIVVRASTTSASFSTSPWVPLNNSTSLSRSLIGRLSIA